MNISHLLHVLLVDDEDIVHETIGNHLRMSGYRVHSAMDGPSALKAMAADDYDLALVDIMMPGMSGLALLARIREDNPNMPVAVITGHASLEAAVRAMQLGAVDFLTKPVGLFELEAFLERVIRFRDLDRDRRRLQQAIGRIQADGDAGEGAWRWVGTSAAAVSVREQIRLVAESHARTILITGETGAGKEVAARNIHALAGPKDSPFIAVTCPAVPDELIASELFGHERGAFTGAVADRPGVFELAEGGTLFLDEIADLHPAAQAAFLGVLDIGAFRRVGGGREIAVNCRVIAATNAPLEARVEAGTFRRDLYYRLNVFHIHLPALRERREDILPLAEHFLTLHAAKARATHFDGFSPEARQRLCAYDYPGNVRELRNMVERATILCRSGQILPEHLSFPQQPAPMPPSLSMPPPPPNRQADPERARILNALDAAHWNRRQAAEALGMTYPSLRYWMQKYGIA